MSLQSEARGPRDSTLKETVKVVVQAVLLAMVVRVFFYQPFNIPSGSMKSTLLVGDYLFVSKLAYGYSRYSFPGSFNLFGGKRLFLATPKRGDVAVFRQPKDTSVDYIKRVIGLPGDEIQVRRGQLIINGQAVPKVRIGDFVTREDGGPPMRIPMYEETLPNGVKYRVLDIEPNGGLDNWPDAERPAEAYKVPPGHYFMMGDNRDNSTDSRVTWSVGPVPLENFVGRAEVIFFSGAFDEPDAFSLWRPWRWPFDIRWTRFFNIIR